MNDTIIKELSQNPLNLGGRRGFLTKLGLATLGGTALAATSRPAIAAQAANATVTETDLAVLNFALNLEYLEAEYYLYATTGMGLEGAVIDVDGGNGEKAGNVIIKKNPKVKFTNNAFEDYANEIALDEGRHVAFLREAITAFGGKPVARPEINLRKSFQDLGNLIGVKNFDPFENDVTFLLGAFIFEDVGVTAYKGASPLITNKTILEAAAGILGVEAYHAGIIRTLLYSQGKEVRKIVNDISKVRETLDDTKRDMDQSLRRAGGANLVPTDANSIVFSRTTRQVLNIVYGGVDAQNGLFFPKGLNGAIA